MLQSGNLSGTWVDILLKGPRTTTTIFSDATRTFFEGVGCRRSDKMRISYALKYWNEIPKLICGLVIPIYFFFHFPVVWGSSGNALQICTQYRLLAFACIYSSSSQLRIFDKPSHLPRYLWLCAPLLSTTIAPHSQIRRQQKWGRLARFIIFLSCCPTTQQLIIAASLWKSATKRKRNFVIFLSLLIRQAIPKAASSSDRKLCGTTTPTPTLQNTNVFSLWGHFSSV